MFTAFETSIFDLSQVVAVTMVPSIEIWRYPSGNKEAEAAARKAATERIGGGRSIVLVPVIPGEQAELFGTNVAVPDVFSTVVLKTTNGGFHNVTVTQATAVQVARALIQLHGINPPEKSSSLPEVAPDTIQQPTADPR